MQYRNSKEVIRIYNPKIKTNTKKLKQYRIIAGLTQVKMAESIHKTESGYIKIENGLCHPAGTTAKSICDVLKIKFDDIFSIENSE